MKWFGSSVTELPKHKVKTHRNDWEPDYGVEL